MNKLEAIGYLVKNGARSSEWQEAGMFDAVSKVVLMDDDTFTKQFLDDLIEDARNN